MDKKTLRTTIFKHLDGIVTAPIVVAIQQKNILESIISEKITTLSNLTEKTSANKGYLNDPLRTLASQGFLEYKVNNEKDEITVFSNSNTEKLLTFVPLYEKIIPFLKETTSSQFQDLPPP